MTPNKCYKTGHNLHCLECDKKYFGDSYVKRVKLGKKYLVRLVTAKMKHDGNWNPKPCEVCGSMERIEGHHEDYDKPKQITWLCRIHHLRHHKLINLDAIA